MKSRIYKQGRSFPPTAHGVGLIFTLIAFLLFFFFSKNYLYFLLCYVSLWIMFSNSSLNTSKIQEGYIIKKFGFFPFYFKRKIKLSDYDAAVIKVENVRYRTTQSTGSFVLSSQDTGDSFLALSLKLKGKYEYEVLYKGKRNEINAFIKDNLIGTHLRFFNGVLKKEHELSFEK